MAGTLSSKRGRQWAVALASTALVGSAVLVPAASADEGRHSGPRHDRKLSASLKGEREVPGPGDPDGRGTARIKLKGSQVCFHLSWRNIEAPVAAHIHVGARDVAGPVVVGLFGTPLDPNLTSVGGCAEAEPALIAEIRKRPRAYYVNIHNATYPGGAIRGQLHR
jgi:hypothetical protein